MAYKGALDKVARSDARLEVVDTGAWCICVMVTHDQKQVAGHRHYECTDWRTEEIYEPSDHYSAEFIARLMPLNVYQPCQKRPGAYSPGPKSRWDASGGR